MARQVHLGAEFAPDLDGRVAGVSTLPLVREWIAEVGGAVGTEVPLRGVVVREVGVKPGRLIVRSGCLILEAK